MFLRGSPVAKGHPWPPIERILDRQEVVLRVQRKTGALGHVLTKQPLVVPVVPRTAPAGYLPAHPASPVPPCHLGRRNERANPNRRPLATGKPNRGPLARLITRLHQKPGPNHGPCHDVGEGGCLLPASPRGSPGGSGPRVRRSCRIRLRIISTSESSGTLKFRASPRAPTRWPMIPSQARI